MVQRRKNKTVWKRCEVQPHFVSTRTQRRAYSEDGFEHMPNYYHPHNGRRSADSWSDFHEVADAAEFEQRRERHFISMRLRQHLFDTENDDDDDADELELPTQTNGRMKPEQQQSSSTAHLSDRQIDRLRSVLSDRVDIHGRGNFPTISVRLVDLIICVRQKLRDTGVPPRQVKMNGGAASYVVAAEECFPFSDLDLIFPITFDSDDTFELIRTAVFAALVDLMPHETTDKTRITADTLKDVYVRKMVKVKESDRWSLFSLHNNYGRCIELKFVDRMRRQFEFSVDSFQITLDPLLDDYSDLDSKIVIESVFGDIRQALEHLDQRLIETRRPEEIRGGGLLKYCHLLTRGYKAARPSKCRNLERYMCSRFFIDFPDVAAQEAKLRSYLDSHFSHSFDVWSSSGGEDTDSEASTSQVSSHPSLLQVQQLKYDYLLLLYSVISESTVCLMSHERRQTLLMVDRLAYQISMTMYASNSRHDILGGVQKQTLLYLPKDSNQWITVPVI